MEKKVRQNIEKVLKTLKKDKLDFIFLDFPKKNEKIKTEYFEDLFNNEPIFTSKDELHNTINGILYFRGWNVSEEDMEKYRKYHPIIIVDEEIEDKYTGWTSKFYDGYTIFLNRNIKQFPLIFDEKELKKIKKVKEKGSPVKGERISIKDAKKSLSYNEKKREKKEEHREKKITQPVTKLRPNEPNFDKFKILPEPSIIPDPKNRTWRSEFYTYLKHLILTIMPEQFKDKIDYILNETTLNTIWIPCFTSVLYSPNTGDNYEVFEIVGDALMEHVFFTYMENRYGNDLNQGKFTVLKQQILSTDFQGLWGEKLKLHKWIILPQEVYSMVGNNMKIKEDLLEAFCGALDKAFNKTLSMGMGNICVYNMFKMVLDDYNFDTLKSTSKTRIEQFIEMINTSRKIEEKKIVLAKPNDITIDIWNEVMQCASDILYKNGITEEIVSSKGEAKKDKGVKEIIEQDKDGLYHTKIFLNKTGAQILKEKGIKIKENTLLGHSISPTKGPGSEKAYSEALNTIEKYGITDEWLAERRKEKNRYGINFLDEVLIKSREKNKKIREVEIINAKKLKTDSIYQIIGYDKDDNKYIIHTYIPEIKKGNLKQETVNDYLGLED